MPKRLRTAAVVITRESGDRIPRIVVQFRRIPIDEIYVVCCGCDPRAIMAARLHGARAVEAPAACSDGAAIATGVSQSLSGDVFLCTDGRFVYPAEWLSPYLEAASHGADVVLNDVSSTPTRMRMRELSSSFLNCATGAIDAGSNSLTVFPFCLSRRAVECIGLETLAALPSALLMARLAGLRVESVGPVPTSTTDPSLLNENEDCIDAEADDFFREHLTALRELIAARGPRGAFSDHNRRRDLLVEGSR